MTSGCHYDYNVIDKHSNSSGLLFYCFFNAWSSSDIGAYGLLWQGQVHDTVEECCNIGVVIDITSMDWKLSSLLVLSVFRYSGYFTFTFMCKYNNTMASGVMIVILSDVLEEEKWSIGTPRAELVKEAASYLLDKAVEPAFDSFSKDLQELLCLYQLIKNVNTQKNNYEWMCKVKYSNSFHAVLITAPTIACQGRPGVRVEPAWCLTSSFFLLLNRSLRPIATKYNSLFQHSDKYSMIWACYCLS